MNRIAALLFCCISTCLFAQLPDSIQRKLDLLSEEYKTLLLDSLADKTLRQNIDLHQLIVQEGIAHALELESDSLHESFLIKLGLNHLYRYQYDSARILYQQVHDNTKNERVKATALGELGISYYYESNDSEALKYLIESYKLWKEIGDTLRLAGITNNLGVIQRYLGDYKNSNYFLKQALIFKKHTGQTVTLGSTYHNLGINFDEMGQPDSSLYYSQKAKLIREKYNDVRGLAKTYSSLGKIYMGQSRYDSSLFFYDKAITIDRNLKDFAALSSDQISMAEALLRTGRHRKSIALLTEALNVTRDARVKQDGLKLLATNYDAIHSYKDASSIKEQLLSLRDSINTAEKETSLQELRVQFDTEQKESQIAQLSAENEIQELKAQQDAQTKTILAVGLIALLIIAALLYSRSRTKSKNNEVLDAKNKELAVINQTKDRLFSIISHDLKSPLSSFHLITQSLAQNLDNLKKEQLKEYLESLRDSSANVRDMMDNLLKWALAQTDQLGYKMEPVALNDVLNGVVNQLNVVSNAKEISIDTNLIENLKLQGDASFLEIVIRNLLSNSLKFTESGKSITLETREEGDQAIIRVMDQGVGMEQTEIEKLLAGEILGAEIHNSTEKGTGLGITLVQELVKKMEGQLQVTSEKGRGTTFELLFKKAA
ncbi:MAG: tetratricopeptide repeat-containing sensor histidine kinase [bacterium]|nr:tetratricopeptide repeat-containing sensor histidine kinase [bacterium]